MSVLTPIGILIISILTMGFLCLNSGVLALLCHYSYGKYSRKKAETLTFFFILGTETVSSCIFFSVYLLVATINANLPYYSFDAIVWVLIGILIALAISSLFFYFRPGPGTRLFIPRSIASALNHHARLAKNRSDAFTLGALSSIPELLFTLPLYIITSAEILQMASSDPFSPLLTILYIVVPTIPLFIERWLFHHGHNLADAERSRVHNKTFTRIILCANYLIIAVLLICFRT